MKHFWIFVLFVTQVLAPTMALATPPKDVEGRDFRAPLIMKDLSVTPGAPSAGFQKIYPKNGKFYTQTSGGVEKLVGSGAGSGAGVSILDNGGFEDSASGSFTLGTGTTAATSTSDKFEGLQSTTLSIVNSGADVISQSVTPAIALAGNNLEHAIRYKTSLTNAVLCALNAGVEVSCVNLPASTTWQQALVNFPAPASGSIGIKVKTTSATTGTLQIDDTYVGIARNLGTVSQATVYGGIVWPYAALCSWNASASSFATFPPDTDCGTPTLIGNAVSPSTKVPGIKFSSLPPGRYMIVATGSILNETAGQTAVLRFTDGTNSTQEQLCMGNANAIGCGAITGYLEYSTPQTNVTIELQQKSGGAGISIYNRTVSGIDSQFNMYVYRYPLASEQGVRQNQQTIPKTFVYTSGSGNYTPSPGTVSIHVRMCGGGGGGAGSYGAAQTSPSAGNGVATTFASASAGGGSNSNTFYPGGGGSASIGSLVVAGSAKLVSGSPGSAGQVGGSSGYPGGGSGGGSIFGSGSAGAPNSAAGNSTVPCSGGGGAGAPSAGGSGGGGGAGGLVEFDLANPSGSYAYVIGTGGAGGANGSGSTFFGGAGAPGILEITEYYGTNTPIIIGSVTSQTSGMERVERVHFAGNSGGTASCTASPCTIVSQSGSWVSSILRNALGDYFVNFAAGAFSAPPVCYVQTSGGNYIARMEAPSTGGVQLYTYLPSTSAGTDGRLHIQCMGPR